MPIETARIAATAINMIGAVVGLLVDRPVVASSSVVVLLGATAFWSSVSGSM